MTLRGKERFELDTTVSFFCCNNKGTQETGPIKHHPGFLERGFKCIKVLGFVSLILSHFFLLSHENEIIWSH